MTNRKELIIKRKEVTIKKKKKKEEARPKLTLYKPLPLHKSQIGSGAEEQRSRGSTEPPLWHRYPASPLMRTACAVRGPYFMFGVQGLVSKVLRV